MTLRDQHGEVDVGIGDLFEYKGATLAVVVPEDGWMVTSRPVICVRLKQGIVEREGRQYVIGEDGKQPLFLFAGDLVAGLIREHRLMTFEIQDDPKTQRTEQSVPKDRRARPSKKRAEQNQPTAQTLFD